MPAKRAHPIILAMAIVSGFFLQAGQARAQSDSPAIFAGGCFWCVEADFEKVDGVSEAISGYTGGTTENPTYGSVTGGRTGHYEAVWINYDPNRVSYERLVYLFLRSIDPLDDGGQFCDRGSSYRTAIFYVDENQRAIAERAKVQAEAELGRQIVTPIIPAQTFYRAEEYHQDYYLGQDRVWTRGGRKTQQEAYEFYRNGCRRDGRVLQVWGPAAPFAK